jgi:hypothetical protein
MKTNEGLIDRVVRVIVGLALLYLGFISMGGATAGLAIGVVGVLALLTGMVGFCPLYALLKINTLRK